MFSLVFIANCDGGTERIIASCPCHYCSHGTAKAILHLEIGELQHHSIMGIKFTCVYFIYMQYCAKHHISQKFISKIREQIDSGKISFVNSFILSELINFSSEQNNRTQRPHGMETLSASITVYEGNPVIHSLVNCLTYGITSYCSFKSINVQLTAAAICGPFY